MAKKEVSEITIVELAQGSVTFCVLGTSPFIYNAMSAKVKQDLLFPPRRKNATERVTTFKHVPREEFRNSVYRVRDLKAEALLAFPAAGFKRSLASTALDVPGAAKTEIARLVWAVGDLVEVYGAPQLLMSVVRMADIARTPDVRTRAILPEWACKVTLTFARPNLNEQDIARLFGAAGMIRGVGDWRQEKGSGNYGQFTLVGPDDPTWKRIVAGQGRKVQEAALAEPRCYDAETEQLLLWYDEEVKRRGSEQPPAPSNGRPARKRSVEAAEA